MKERIRALRKALDMTQQELADRLGLKRNSVAGYEIGRSVPMDAVMKSICREFNVNEEWLRNGAGEMFVQISDEEEIASLVYDLLDPKDDDFYNAVLALVQAYGNLNDSSQQVVREMIRDTMKYYKKRKGD